MEVLNVIEAHISGVQTAAGVFAAVIAMIGVVTLILSIKEGEIFGIIFALIFTAWFGAMAVGAFTTTDVPERLEIRITEPGYVIDAEQYEIIEKRGEIYVLEPLEPTE